MLPGQGIHFPAETIERIKRLLAATDVSLADIADRMECSKSAVASINRKYGIRDYGKKRSRWTVNKDFVLNRGLARYKRNAA
jgi:hypothetical protein